MNSYFIFALVILHSMRLEPSAGQLQIKTLVAPNIPTPCFTVAQSKLHKKAVLKSFDAQQRAQLLEKILAKKAAIVLKRSKGECIKSLAWSPDSHSIAIGSNAWAAYIYDAQTDTRKHILNHFSRVYSVSWSPDSKQLITGAQSRGPGSQVEAFLWDANKGTKTGELHHTESITAVAWSPDGSKVLTGSLDNTVCVWDGNTRNKMRSFVHGDWILSVGWSPNSRFIVAGCRNGAAYIWDLQSNAQPRVLTHTEPVYSVAWSPDSKSIITAPENTTACIWDVATGKKEKVLKHAHQIICARWSHDSRFLATGSVDNTACVWDAQTGEKKYTLKHDYWVSALSWHPQSLSLITSAANKIYRWNIDRINFHEEYDAFKQGLLNPAQYWVLALLETYARPRAQHSQEQVTENNENQQSESIVLRAVNDQVAAIPKKVKRTLRNLVIIAQNEMSDASLKDVVRALMMFHPILRDMILSSYDIDAREIEYELAQEKLFVEKPAIVFGANLIAPILEEYILGAELINSTKILQSCS